MCKMWVSTLIGMYDVGCKLIGSPIRFDGRQWCQTSRCSMELLAASCAARRSLCRWMHWFLADQGRKKSRSPTKKAIASNTRVSVLLFKEGIHSSYSESDPSAELVFIQAAQSLRCR